MRAALCLRTSSGKQRDACTVETQRDAGHARALLAECDRLRAIVETLAARGLVSSVGPRTGRAIIECPGCGSWCYETEGDEEPSHDEPCPWLAARAWVADKGGGEGGR